MKKERIKLSKNKKIKLLIFTSILFIVLFLISIYAMSQLIEFLNKFSEIYMEENTNTEIINITEPSFKTQLQSLGLLAFIPFLISVGFCFLLRYRYLKKQKKENLKKYQELNNKYYIEQGAQINSKKFYCYGQSNHFNALINQHHVIWFSTNQIFLINANYNFSYGKITIPLENLICFSRYGDFYTSTNISGGGTNAAGAVLGYALAGTAGAIAASRQKIQSQTIVHDKRETLLLFNFEGKDEFIFLDPQAYEYLLHIIPNKEFSFVMNINKSKDIPKQNENIHSSIKQLKELQLLKEKGTITEDEFIVLKEKIIIE